MLDAMKARRNMIQAESPSIGPGSGSPKMETKINKSAVENTYKLHVYCYGGIT